MGFPIQWSISVTYSENSNLPQHHSILKLGLLFTECHLEITITAIKCQIYACTKSGGIPRER